MDVKLHLKLIAEVIYDVKMIRSVFEVQKSRSCTTIHLVIFGSCSLRLNNIRGLAYINEIHLKNLFEQILTIMAGRNDSICRLH